MTIALTTWIAAGAIAAAVAAAGVQTVRLANEKADHETSKAGFADARAEAGRIHAKAETEQRAEFERRIKGKDDAITFSKNLSESFRMAAVRADAARGRLQLATDGYIAAAGEACRSAVVGAGGTATESPCRVLADLFRRADDRAGILADYAGKAAAAGLTCERSYDSLTRRE
ncbi:DUF2514 family protein [Polaromonas sp.]|uniref:DUF2514 family protein n=1 Tax=Polaromonas sp. TaxID=1869339 RepID=UPI003564BF53